MSTLETFFFLLQTERTTIILRQIPDGATEDEVRGIFSDLSQDFQPNSVKLEWGDTWFVRMPNEAAAVAAEESLGGKKFKGAPIRARMKSENWIQSLLASSAAAGASAPASATSPTGAFPGAAAFGMPGGFPGAAFPMAPPAGAAFAGMPAGVPAAGSVPTGFGLPMGGATSFPMNFNLPPPPEMGYKGAYISYSQDEIMKIVRHVTMDNIKAHRPEGCDADTHPLAVLAVPDTNLVRRQRSESMDAALAHGRPRFDSVDSVSSVDYRSMMHGAQPPQGASRQGAQAQGSAKAQGGAQRRERSGNRTRGNGGRAGNREEATPAAAPAPAPAKRQPLPEFNEKTAPRLGGGKAPTPKSAGAASGKKGGYAAALLAAKPAGSPTSAAAPAPATGGATPPAAPAASAGVPFMKPPPGAELAPGATPSPQMAAAMATEGGAASKAPAGAAWGKGAAAAPKGGDAKKPAAAAGAPAESAPSKGSGSAGMSFADILKKKNADAAAAAAAAPAAAGAQAAGSATARPVATTRTGPKQTSQAANANKAEFRDFRGLLE